jgi:hypothetical protein
MRPGELRQQGFSVTDEPRGHHLGHAEIELGIRTPTNDEPEDPALKKQLKDRCETILHLARYRTDPDPNSEEWLGESMCE